MPELAQMSAAGDQQTTIEPTSGVLSSGDSPQTVGGGGGRGDVGMAPSRLTDSAMSEANRLVDAAIANAYTELKQDHGFKANEESGGVIIGQNGVKNIEWMTYEQFTVPLGTDKIREFVETWEYEPSWKYCIDFLEEISTEYDFRYSIFGLWSKSLTKLGLQKELIPRASK
ncbi:A-kinase anchor protein 14-like isoform X2 [Convolutriloba macropyga]|uniref:A-kinase anchor protein 14-like isoform X2 n=1 Tax=Convolutriloba macropyga TaxID=536237 RepID=UPI003F51B1A3